MTAPEGYMDFPPEEFHRRYQRAQEAMARQGLDALLVTSQRNYIYFTGHSATHTLPHWFWNLSDARPFAAMLPRDREPFLVIHSIAAAFVEGCWIERRTVWTQEPFQAAHLVEALKEFGLTAGAIGCEFGEEQRLGLPLAAFFAVQEEMPGLQWVDASRLLWDLRMVKSSEEIARIREANRITVQISDRWVAQAHTGMTTRAAGNLLQRMALEEGADYLPLCLFIISGPNGNHRFPPATDRAFQKGDLLYLDIGAQYLGYCADVNRMIHFGSPPEEVRRHFAVLVDLERFLMEHIRPRAHLAQVRAALDNEYRRRGLTPNPHRAGHGIGMQPTEAPSVIGTSEVVLEPGMTITVEPSLQSPSGYRFSLEHDLLVTETGAENLTPALPDLLVVDR